MLHDGRANGKGIGKNVAGEGTMRSKRKRRRTTSVIDPPLHDSIRREFIHSWWIGDLIGLLFGS